MKTYMTKIEEIENEFFLELPDEVIHQMGLKEDDELEIILLDDRIIIRKPADVKLFECRLFYYPVDEDYESDDMEFWNEGNSYLSRCEKEQLPGKVAAYELAKKRAAEYATEVGVQLKYNVTLTDGNISYCSNTYLSKKPKSQD